MSPLHAEKQIKAGLIIPVFNVENTIEKVLASINSKVLDDISEIRIIDNHSSDKTVENINKFMERNPEFARRVSMVLCKENCGYGHSIKTGFTYFLGRPVTHIVVIHGDHQVDPTWLIDTLLAPIKKSSNVDVVLASRFMRESNLQNYSLVRKLGNYFFNLTTFFCTGLLMSDSGTAMIAIKKSTLSQVNFYNLSNSWQFHPQLNILLYDNKEIQIAEVSMNWTDSEAKSSVPLIMYGLKLLKMLLEYRVAKTILRKNPDEIFPANSINLEQNRSIVKFDKI